MAVGDRLVCFGGADRTPMPYADIWVFHRRELHPHFPHLHSFARGRTLEKLPQLGPALAWHPAARDRSSQEPAPIAVEIMLLENVQERILMVLPATFPLDPTPSYPCSQYSSRLVTLAARCRKAPH